MEEDKILKAIKKLSNLPQYRDLPDNELREIVLTKDKKEIIDEDLDIENMFIDKDERKEAKTLLKKYLTTYSLDTPSDKNTIRQLVFLEVFNNRLQRELNNYYKEEQPAPPKTVESLHSNLNQITGLKDKLGLSKDKKGKDLSEGYSVLDTMFKKWKIWRAENQGSRTLNCPHCGKMVLLKIRMKEWEAQKHPFFKDRILANTHLMELYKLGKITKQDVALVLGTSIDYVSWLVEKIYYREFSDITNKNNLEELESGETE